MKSLMVYLLLLLWVGGIIMGWGIRGISDGKHTCPPTVVARPALCMEAEAITILTCAQEVMDECMTQLDTCQRQTR